MEFKLELVMVPVSDVDRALEFYERRAGFHLDVDTRPTDTMRVVQLTPPGSACAIVFGTGMTDKPPGSLQGTHLMVTDIVAARAELAERGLEISEVTHMGPGGWQPGPHPERNDYSSFAHFQDPDGNGWVVQERGHN